jgi:hypothetical protein
VRFSLRRFNTGQFSNAFFYVSSGRWNLYRLSSILRQYKTSKQLLLLKDIKSGLTDFL